MLLRKTILGVFVSLCLGVPSLAWIPTAPGYRRSRLTVLSSTAPTSSTNNVVLRPSADPNAFDSFRIGSARVHRYVRDSDDVESEAEYVMWYHGRSETFDEQRELPPLSTGRIGRATSRNGLVWEKTAEGSPSEDAPDVILGLNKDSWWGFDTAHVGLGQVLLPMSTPAVMSEGGVYLMYYMGGNFEEAPVANFLENVPEAAAKAKIKGMQLKIGVAVSQDGMSWGRVEGDHPSGACMAPFDLADPNAKGLTSMRDENGSHVELEEELYCGWPDVVPVTTDDIEIEEGVNQPGFFMYYSTMKKSDKQKCIALAVSPDGFRWFKRGVIVEPDASGLDAAGCARCNVVANAEFNEETNVWKETKGWKMFYEGVSKEDNKHRIMMAESEDGRTWEKAGVALDVGDTWDCGGVGSPHVLKLDDGTMRMYYTGQGEDGSTAIGVARLVPETGTWAREQAEFSFAL